MRSLLSIPALILLAAGCGKSTGTDPGASSPSRGKDPTVETIKANDLVLAFRENEVAADKRFTGKVIRVNARLQKIAKGGATGRYFVGQFYYTNRTDGDPDVIYLWDQSKLGELETQKPDLVRAPEMVIQGLCKGWQPNAGARLGYSVILENCSKAD